MEIIMDRTFQKFLQSKIDLSSVGVEFREDNAPYFCTPKGASIFGWAGVTVSISALFGALGVWFLPLAL